MGGQKEKHENNNICYTFCMFKIGSITFYFNRIMALALVILLFLFFPSSDRDRRYSYYQSFVKERLAAIGILFLVLRSIIHEYYTTNLALLFLVILFFPRHFPCPYGSPHFSFDRISEIGSANVIFGRFYMIALKSLLNCSREYNLDCS